MYIEFRLPNGSAGQAAAHACRIIRMELADWAARYDVPYKTKIHKYTLRVSLLGEQDYVHFQLSWDPKHRLGRDYVLVEPGQILPENLTD